MAICLTGTTSVKHMAEDLDVYDFELKSDEIRHLETVGL